MHFTFPLHCHGTVFEGRGTFGKVTIKLIGVAWRRGIPGMIVIRH